MTIAHNTVVYERHTPGPWRIGPTEQVGQVGLLRVIDESGRLIAFCEAEKDTPTTFVRAFTVDKANARLIAAAPDLLATARCLVCCEDENDLGVFSASVDNVIAMAKLAIAKVEGR